MVDIPEMTPQQGLTLQRWIEDKGIPYQPCACGSTALVASTKFFGAIACTSEMAAVVCTDCARVQFLSLRVISGLTD
jgi:hypothetical protein